MSNHQVWSTNTSCSAQTGRDIPGIEMTRSRECREGRHFKRWNANADNIIYVTIFNNYINLFLFIIDVCAKQCYSTGFMPRIKWLVKIREMRSTMTIQINNAIHGGTRMAGFGPTALMKHSRTLSMHPPIPGHIEYVEHYMEVTSRSSLHHIVKRRHPENDT